MSSMVLDGAMPRSRVADPVTSVDAGRSADLKGAQAAVLELMRDFSVEHGWTQEELSERLRFDWSPSRVRSSVSELVALGLIEDAGSKRPTRYGRMAIVWRAVASG